ncbi:MAG: hypothetical protein RL698_3171 [Pseudomonadota bacterium]
MTEHTAAERGGGSGGAVADAPAGGVRVVTGGGTAGPPGATPGRRARGGDALVGASESIQRLRADIRCFARSDACVLVEGETGTGKELVARALHEESARAAGPFVPVNCGALPEQLVESELFGHLRGAFTGAHRDHPGLVEAAARGTLFLDEIEDLPPPLQGKLLRLLQEGEYRPLGAVRARSADVRVVAASNAQLAGLVAERRFRSDLFYRLDVLHLEVPPLRARPEDVDPLVAHFLARTGRPRAVATGDLEPPPECLAWMRGQSWPGNVRELANLVERAVVLVAEHGAARGWAVAISGAGRVAAATAAPPPRPPARFEQAESPEASALRRLLDRHRWRRDAAAREMGVSRVTLWRRMRRLGLVGAPADSGAG